MLASSRSVRRALIAALLVLPMLAGAQALPAPQPDAASGISAAFSPHEGSMTLVLRAIRSAQSRIDVAAYLFTSSEVARALADAARRGVRVRLLVDRKCNLEEQARYAQHALSIVQLAGVEVRTIDAYAIFHDKYMVIDGRTVQTGSFNYTYSAAHRNAENVIVVWNDPQLAARFAADWARNWLLGQPLPPRY